MMFPLAMLTGIAAAAAQAGAPDQAIEAVVESSRQTISAKQLERPSPRYPPLELRKGNQAWVHVGYCIDESGNTQNVTVIDSVGRTRFDEAAVATVRKWKFEPALVDGEPSWQSRNDAYITFAIEGGNRGAASRFARQFHKLGKLIDERKMAEADELFWRVHDTYELSLYELAKLWAQRVRYEAVSGDMYRMDMALHRATASKGEWIDEDSYIRLLGIRAKVEVQLGKYHAARRSYRALVNAAGKESDEAQALKPVMERLRELIASGNVLRVSAEIRKRGECIYCDSSWHFIPVRSDFTIANISGRLDAIEMRCDHKRYRSAVAELVEWKIPEAWGTCHVQFYGDPGTTFDVLQIPSRNDE